VTPTDRELTAEREPYFASSRAIGPSLAMVLPLLLAHELAVSVLDPPVRNSADQAVIALLSQLPGQLLPALRWAGLLILLTILALRRPRSGLRPALVLGESLLLAICLGPVVGGLVDGLGLSAGSRWVSESAPLWQPMLLSVGAGLWEEITFRLALLGGLALLLRRATRCPPAVSLGLAILVSAVAFSLYHHVGATAEPLSSEPFVFRAIAGTILGILFALRGLAVVVYMHVFYDLLCDLRMALA
jgi:hypothetical protein